MNVRCFLKGHQVECVDYTSQSGALAYQKGERQWNLFKGKLYYCIREDCDYERYVGPREPYKTVTSSVCDGILELDGTKYRRGKMVRGVQVLWPLRPTSQGVPRKEVKSNLTTFKGLEQFKP